MANIKIDARFLYLQFILSSKYVIIELSLIHRYLTVVDFKQPVFCKTFTIKWILYEFNIV